MNEREQFEAKMREFGFDDTDLLCKQLDSGEWWYYKLEIQSMWTAWQAATALHQDTINSLLALVEKKNEALKYAIETIEDTEMYPNLSKALHQFLTLTPEKMRLVEVGYAVQNIKTKQFHCNLQPSIDVALDTIRQESERGFAYGNPTKLYTIDEVNE